MSSGRRKFSHV